MDLDDTDTTPSTAPLSDGSAEMTEMAITVPYDFKEIRTKLLDEKCTREEYELARKYLCLLLILLRGRGEDPSQETQPIFSEADYHPYDKAQR